MPFTHEDITRHSSREYTGAAINVKVYQYPHDAHPAHQRVMEEFQVDLATATKALDYAYHQAVAEFWYQANAKVKELYGERAHVFSMGRSDGWLYVAGIGGESFEDWEAPAVEKWGELVAWCANTIDTLTSWWYAREEIAIYIADVKEDAADERVRDAAPELLEAGKAALTRMEGMYCGVPERFTTAMEPVMEQLRAAIAKAGA